jgi:hypothetical protein
MSVLSLLLNVFLHEAYSFSLKSEAEVSSETPVRVVTSQPSAVPNTSVPQSTCAKNGFRTEKLIRDCRLEKNCDISLFRGLTKIM